MLTKGAVALITGATGGLGSAVTRAFLEAGATVAGVSRSVREGEFDGPNFLAFPAELTSSEAALSLAAQVLAKAGRIDILVHLVGTFEGGMDVHATDDSLLDRMLETNLKSMFYMAKAVLPHMRERRQGRIIAIGSRAAVEAGPKVAAYSASKAALVALVRAIAAENAGHGISANVVLPGTIDTPGNRAAMPKADRAKWVAPDQIARLILALASEGLSQVSGAAIPIYGSDIE